MRDKIRMNSSAGTGHFYTTDKNKRTTPDKLEIFKKSWPIPRLGRPADIADCVLFFASNRTSILTGQTVSVSGGVAMW